MRFGSVCSGIEAASVAWHPLGWSAAFFSEIEPFPCAVLAHHYPDTPNHGDMTKFKEWPDAAIDVLVGGTPCQSFSVAGLRAGLDDPRGNLMLTFGAVAARYRPEWIVWENVPGVLSSNGGRDFGSFLGLLGQLGYGFAYRVLDAQFVRVDGLERAVPQRRRRVFVVGCLGDWRRAAAVLLERESLRGNPAPRREAGEGSAAGVIKGAAIGRKPSAGPQYGDAITDGSCYTLTTNEVHAVAGTPMVSHALRSEGFDASEDGTGRGTPLVPTYTLAIRGRGDSQDVAGAIGARTGISRGAQDAACRHMIATPAIAFGVGMQVRRLTPLECARLQGFPDDYLDIQFRGKPATDSAKYKALGNSMAVNCMRWSGTRIQMVEAIEKARAAA